MGWGVGEWWFASVACGGRAVVGWTAAGSSAAAGASAGDGGGSPADAGSDALDPVCVPASAADTTPGAPCTTDADCGEQWHCYERSCVGGACAVTQRSEGAPCKGGDGSCNAAGEC